MKSLMKNNKGFSLVEMIVVVLISGILMLGVIAFIQSSRVTYQKVNTSSRLQEEAGTATNFVNELLVEAIECGTTTGTYSGKAVDVLWIRALDNEPTGFTDAEIRKTAYYFIIYEKPVGTSPTGYLRYMKVAEPCADISFVENLGVKSIVLDADFFDGYIGNPYVTICEYIKNMSVSQIDRVNGRMFRVEFEFEFNGESYSASVNNYSRNNTPTD